MPALQPTSNPDDARLADLMRRAQAGDETAYASLLRDLLPILRRIVRARRSLVADADTEDVVQEILLSVHAVRATYDPARAFLPWLLAIARHRILDAARRTQRRAGRELGLDDADVTFDESATNTSMEGDGGRDAVALHGAIAQLPPGQQAAIRLLKLEERSLKEAAEMSGQSVGSLKVATHRAMLALRKRLVGD